MICYRLKDKIFFNAYTAFLYAAENCPHEHVYFDVHDHVFDQVDWTQYPATSYPELYQKRAQQIRDKYEKIVVAFSGGTDSTTMLSAFFDNNIHVDAVYIGHYNNDDHYASYAANPDQLTAWIKQTWPEQAQHTEIVPVDLTQFVETRYRRNEWILDQNCTFHSRFVMGTVPQGVSELFDHKYGAFRWGLITGHEKPELSPDNQWVYYIDKTFSHVMNRANAEFFYLSADLPEIIVKQAHDIANFQSMGNQDYYQMKHIIGIGGDVGGAKSQAEKTIIKETTHIISQINFSQISESLAKLSLRDNNCMIDMVNGYQHWKQQLVKNWAHGIASLQTDSTLINYMITHGYLSSPTQGIQSYHGIHSKRYRISV
jgi:hypothetical protein